MPLPSVVHRRQTKSGSCTPKACLILVRLMDHYVAVSIVTSTGEPVHGSCTQVRVRNLSIIAGKGCGAVEVTPRPQEQPLSVPKK